MNFKFTLLIVFLLVAFVLPIVASFSKRQIKNKFIVLWALLFLFIHIGINTI